MIGWLYPKTVSFIESPPLKGNKMIGSSDVIAIGKASVIHQTATHRVEAAIAKPLDERFSGLIKKYKIMNKNGPKNSPIFFFDITTDLVIQ